MQQLPGVVNLFGQGSLILAKSSALNKVARAPTHAELRATTHCKADSLSEFDKFSTPVSSKMSSTHDKQDIARPTCILNPRNGGIRPADLAVNDLSIQNNAPFQL